MCIFECELFSVDCDKHNNMTPHYYDDNDNNTPGEYITEGYVCDSEYNSKNNTTEEHLNSAGK